jgi:YHS domain-containing protein
MAAIFTLAGMLALLLGGGDNLELKGYDPVAYFTAGKPVKGEAKFEHKFMGATYRFSSQANLELFKKEPAKYVQFITTIQNSKPVPSTPGYLRVSLSSALASAICSASSCEVVASARTMVAPGSKFVM